MSTKENPKSDPYDRTSTKRAKNALQRLADRNGKRLPIDFDGTYLEMLDALKATGYGKTSADVLRRALAEAHAANVPSTDPIDTANPKAGN